ncbi:MAG: UDP-N-acetylglucosamine 2-epimerase (non-hydrolyzing) [Gammaproteobacteria bacterium]
MNASPARLLVVIGTRPDAIKMAPVVEALRAAPGFEVVVCASGQHRELLAPVLADLALTPDLTLPAPAASASLGATCASLVGAFDDCLARTQPTRVIVQGDTNTCFAASLAAFYRGVPLAHVEAGLRSARLDAPWPEEFNRRVVTLAADLHFAPTATAAQALLDEGVPDARIHVTGNTVVDALFATRARLDADAELARRAAADLPRPAPGRRLIAATLHRREAIGHELEGMCLALRDLVARQPLDVALPVHGNPEVRAAIERILGGVTGIHLLAPLGYLAFVTLLRRAWVVVTDSGGVQEEAPSLDVPVVVARNVTERSELVVAGGAVLAGTARGSIVSAVESLLADEARYHAMQVAPNPFGDGHAAARIVDVLRRDGAASAPAA